MARNYGKKTRRYAVGGIVPKQADDDERMELDHSKGERELPQYRHKSRDQKADDTGEQDVHPDDYLVPEDQDA